MGSWHRRIDICSVTLLVLLFSMAPASAEPVHLVEIIYEFDFRSLDGRPLPTSSRDVEADPQGYILADSGSAERRVLYPAMGAPLPETSATGLWAALRFRDRLTGAGVDAKTLEPIAALPYSPNLQPATAITPVFNIAVTEVDDGDIVVEVDGIAQTLAPGVPMAVAVGDRTVSVDEFAGAVLEAYAKAGVPQAGMPSREAVLEEVQLFALGGDEVTFHARLVAVNHGPVTLADIDLAKTLNDARRLSREGPYEEALAALETLLDVMPRHAEAARLFHEMLDLVEAGATPARAIGTVRFPAGQPDDRIRALWKASHKGFALFARPDDPPGSAIMAIPVQDGAFAAHLPAGTYRLTISIPGFAKNEIEITLNGETKIDVPLAASN